MVRGLGAGGQECKGQCSRVRAGSRAHPQQRCPACTPGRHHSQPAPVSVCQLSQHQWQAHGAHHTAAAPVRVKQHSWAQPGCHGTGEARTTLSALFLITVPFVQERLVLASYSACSCRASYLISSFEWSRYKRHGHDGCCQLQLVSSCWVRGRCGAAMSCTAPSPEFGCVSASGVPAPPHLLTLALPQSHGHFPPNAWNHAVMGVHPAGVCDKERQQG